MISHLIRDRITVSIGHHEQEEKKQRIQQHICHDLGGLHLLHPLQLRFLQGFFLQRLRLVTRARADVIKL